MNARSWIVIAAVTVCVAGAGAAAGARETQGASAPPDQLSLQSAQIKAQLAAESAAAAAEREEVAGDPAQLQAAIDAKSRDAASHEAAASAGAESAGADAWPTGIFEDTEAPAPGIVFLASNRWVGAVGQTTVAVYAGVSGSDASTGRLLVAVEGPATVPTIVDLAGTGALRVTSAAGPVLTVTDAAGRVHLFDVATGTWQS